MTAPTPLAATTEQGSGLILPIAKALAHITSVYTAIVRDWPMSIADASAELDDALVHFQNAKVPHGLMTAEATSAIDIWREVLQERIHTLQDSMDLDAQVQTLDTEPLKQLSQDTWQLLVNLDLELTGLEPRDVDPGNLP